MIIKELIGPWVFGVGMFSSLLIAATYLGKLAGYLVSGAPPTMVLQLTLMFLPPMVVKTFSMAMLLSALLGFGRLSSDSEMVALRAAGASLYRIILPVAIFSLLVAVFTFLFDETVVPRAATGAVNLINQIDHLQRPGAGPDFSKNLLKDDKLQLSISAAHVDVSTGELHNATVVVYGPDEKQQAVMTAPLIRWAGPNDEMKFIIPQGCHFTSLVAPHYDTDIKGEVWPADVPQIGTTFQILITPRDDNFDEQSMSELHASILRHQKKKDRDPHDMANYQYGYWNKISVPLAALVFGCLGAVLGIRNHRTGTAAGFALAVAIIFGYFMLANFMNVWALGGVIPAWVASFSPLAIGMVATVVIMKRRNA